MADAVPTTRCAVLVGPYTSGKTTLLEAMLFTAGAVARKGRVADGSSFGDTSPEARARQMTAEPNFAHFEYLGEPWTIIDCPGSVELAQDALNALMVADIAVVVAEADPEKAASLSPLLKLLDDHAIPHLIFVNKMDRATARVRELLAAFQTVSSRPLLLRQVPIREGEEVVGFVDLVSERAWRYQENQPSALIQMPDDHREREAEARRLLMESLADFDDDLLEQLLEDKEPAPDTLYEELRKGLQGDLIVPVLFGTAETNNGVTRLMKALRHEAPTHEQAAARLAVEAAPGEAMAATVFKTFHLPHTGKVSVARIWHGGLREGGALAGERLSGLVRLQGGAQEKLSQANAGDVVAFARVDALQTGHLVTDKRIEEANELVWPDTLTPVYSLALQPENRQDEVKLTASLTKICEEDPSLAFGHDPDTHEFQLSGQGEIHLQLALERLKNRYNVAVVSRPPTPAYKETIRRGANRHARYKRQTGGHGQFADIKVRVDPLPRGEGFRFQDKVVGGSVPRNFIPAVEAGVRDYLKQGPLGFPVVDLEVTLLDGQHHPVDSSDMAFRTAGRLALSEALPECEPVLLEPICKVSIFVPQEHTNKVHGLISARRGQILGYDARPGWAGWDEVQAHMPQAELSSLIIELRSLTLGLGSYVAEFHHLQELRGREADRVIGERQQVTA
jgi:elongation factor G